MNRKQANLSLIVAKWIGMLFIASAVCAPAASLADEIDATASERAACTPDVFRLCSSEIPNVDRIIACMVSKKSSLSAPCKSVFDKREHARKADKNAKEARLSRAASFRQKGGQK